MYGMDRKQIMLVAILVGAIVFGAGYKLAQTREKSSLQPVVTVKKNNPEEKLESRKVTVYVSGAIKKPGVYTFSEGSRILDVVYKAGPAKDAALEYINLAEVMSDGQQISVPRKSEVNGNANLPSVINSGAGRTVAAGLGTKMRKVNINTANKDTLDSLLGVGPATADKIIEYRKQNGKFKNISELLKVTGIGEKKLAKIKENISI